MRKSGENLGVDLGTILPLANKALNAPDGVTMLMVGIFASYLFEKRTLVIRRERMTLGACMARAVHCFCRGALDRLTAEYFCTK